MTSVIAAANKDQPIAEAEPGVSALAALVNRLPDFLACPTPKTPSAKATIDAIAETTKQNPPNKTNGLIGSAKASSFNDCSLADVSS